VETAIIEHSSRDVETPEFSKEAVSESQVPRLSSRDSFHGLPEMNSFDGYLHLTALDTPMTPPTAGTSPMSSGLTPREIFFIDLIKQAEENERAPGIRRSMGDENIPSSRSTADNRKSMPLYLYCMKDPESSFSSSKDVLGVPSAAGCPLKNKDLISVADSENYSLSSPTQNITSDELQSNCERFENAIEPQCNDPVDQCPENGSTVTQPADTKIGKDGSVGEYFIANVARNKSITSEVYLTIEDNDTKVVEPGGCLQWELVVDDSHDDYLSDDCVFEDDVAVKKKK